MAAGILPIMLTALGQRLASFFRAVLPDPLVIAILLTLLTIVLALAVGFPATDAAPRLILPTDPCCCWIRSAAAAACGNCSPSPCKCA